MSVDSTDAQIEENDEALVTVQVNGTPVEIKVDIGVKCHFFVKKGISASKEKRTNESMH